MNEEEEYKREFAKYSAAAKAGDTAARDAMYERGMEYYRKGEYEKAMEWLEVAAEKGNGNACLYIGNMYDKGLGVSKDDFTASQLLKKARKLLGSDVEFPNG